ncbi:hypothetical protein ICW40_16520 [Actinotalea ferrariae]|uniref:hypothetical protein n=1 Tax=Actinotalea ferrariae TaxID=1386098 RepID=UPI001C8C3D63|nr:hypothetical protein [Actinotalea ferrariae]MBX9246400.1 hypothetical protein [Actinotalea ferrariae]
MAGERTYAFGVLLRLTTTAGGGRQTPILRGSDRGARWAYRPNWGLPQMTAPEQTGAPVLAFSKDKVFPGDEVRAVIVPPFPQMVAAWSCVAIGDELPMYEGLRTCGHGRVLWRRDTVLPIPDHDRERFVAWALNPTMPMAPD